MAMTPSTAGEASAVADRVLAVFGETVIIRRDPAGQLLDAVVIEEIVSAPRCTGTAARTRSPT
jgi:hypothetical protein